MKHSGQRRLCTRTSFQTRVLVSAESQPQFETELINISIGGLYVRSASELAVGTACLLAIEIGGRNSRLIIDSIRGTVVRSEPGGLALQFESHLEWFVLFKIYTPYSPELN